MLHLSRPGGLVEMLVREILVHGADGDAGPLRHPSGGKTPFALRQQNLNGRFADRIERGLGSRLTRCFAGL
jgi:hypothetical protein